jgi:predicted 3-demethylubiquinone-9 3-methyltransferase (glyoxalase superfamily)
MAMPASSFEPEVPTPMSKVHMQKIVPHLWYVKEAEEAGRFYASVGQRCRVHAVGRSFMAINAGPHHDFNDAVSFLVNCSSQEDATGTLCGRTAASPRPAGGSSTSGGQMITDPDKPKAKRVAEEMLKQVKFDVAKLEAAFQVAERHGVARQSPWGRSAAPLLAFPTIARPIDSKSDSMLSA